MKTFILLATLFISGSVVAGTPAPASNTTPQTSTPVSTANSQQGQQQQQEAVAGATNAGNNQAITFTTPANTSASVTQTVSSTGVQKVTETVSGSTSNDTTLRNVPNVNAPSLTSSNDTCMGSTSVGGGVVGVGLSFGTTWTDKNCVMLKNSRELWNMGMRGAAMARMCMDKLNREALEMTGFVCPQTEREKAKQK